MGIVLWEVETKRPLVTVGAFLYDEKTYPEIEPEAQAITGITKEMLKEFGTDPKANLTWLDGFCGKHKVEYLVGHNSEAFDRPLLHSELGRTHVEGTMLRTLPWIDSRWDIPFATEPDTRKLKHLALDAGFINPFSHRAVFDVLSMLRILSNYNLDDVLAFRNIPNITVRALVSFDEKELAKIQKYRWENKMWVKTIKENTLDDERKRCSFEIRVLEK